MKRSIVGQALALSRRHPVFAAAVVIVYGAWALSQFYVIYLHTPSGISTHSVTIWSGYGRLSWRYDHNPPAVSHRFLTVMSMAAWRDCSWVFPESSRPDNKWGILYKTFDLKCPWGKWSGLEVSIPYWGMAMLLAALCYVRVRWSGRGKRCATACSCGYDLTGNTSGICPECGTHVKPSEDAR